MPQEYTKVAAAKKDPTKKRYYKNFKKVFSSRVRPRKHDLLPATWSTYKFPIKVGTFSEGTDSTNSIKSFLSASDSYRLSKVSTDYAGSKDHPFDLDREDFLFQNRKRRSVYL